LKKQRELENESNNELRQEEICDRKRGGDARRIVKNKETAMSLNKGRVVIVIFKESRK